VTDWGEFQADLAYEQYQEEQYLEQVAEEGVDAFSRERLQAYYRENPNVAEKSLNALRTAEILVDVSASASLVFAAVSLELTIKNVILRPLVHGLVHNEALAGFVAQYAVGRRGTKWFDRLLQPLLRELADVDLSTYRREGQSVTLWEEVLRVTKFRNDVLHDGEAATSDQATTALDASATLLRTVFPAVVQALELTIDEELRIGDGEARPE